MKNVYLSLGVVGVALTALLGADQVVAGGEKFDSTQPVVRPKTVRSDTGTVEFGENVALGVVSQNATKAIVVEIKKGASLCGRIQPEYRVDCISDRLARVAASLPNTGDYADAKKALEDAARKLHALAQNNTSTTLPRARIAPAGGKAGAKTRPLTPVNTESVNAVNRQAAAIIAEAETVLLRSAENSQKRKGHYQQIAQAVGTNKVLLRSL